MSILPTRCGLLGLESSNASRPPPPDVATNAWLPEMATSVAEALVNPGHEPLSTGLISPAQTVPPQPGQSPQAQADTPSAWKMNLSAFMTFSWYYSVLPSLSSATNRLNCYIELRSPPISLRQVRAGAGWRGWRHGPGFDHREPTFPANSLSAIPNHCFHAETNPDLVRR